MIATVEHGDLAGTIPAIPSKSVAHRALICAALADVPTRIRCASSSVDIDTTVSCLTSLGAQITRTGEFFEVVPIKHVARNARLNCHESGSTYRFLLSVVAALGGGATFTGAPRLGQRPIAPLDKELTSHGCMLSATSGFPLTLDGMLKGGTFHLPGDVSSQFVTGLLLAAPLLDSAVAVEVTEPIQSKSYIDITTHTMAQFGVMVEVTPSADATTYTVAANARYTSPSMLEIEGDWSNSAFWLVASVLSDGAVFVRGLNVESPQGDRAMLSYLEAFGVELEQSDTIRALPSRLHATEIDVSDSPDLVPPLAILAALAEGETRITGAARLRIKESDRLKTVTAALTALGAHITEEADGLIIEGGRSLTGATIDAANDHRIAMMGAIAATQAQGATIIQDAGCVSKSYPDFFSDLKSLGAHIEVEE